MTIQHMPDIDCSICKNQVRMNVVIEEALGMEFECPACGHYYKIDYSKGGKGEHRQADGSDVQGV